MKRMQIVLMGLVVALMPCTASAVLITALDFTVPGDWTITHDLLTGPAQAELEADGDPTKVRLLPVGGDNAGNAFLDREVFAPAGFTMSNIRLEAIGVGFSSHVRGGRVALSDDNITYTDYFDTTGASGGEEIIIADSSGDPDYTGVSSVWVRADIFNALGLAGESSVRSMELFADLTAIPEPTSLVLLTLGSVFVMSRRRRR